MRARYSTGALTGQKSATSETGIHERSIPPRFAASKPAKKESVRTAVVVGVALGAVVFGAVGVVRASGPGLGVLLFLLTAAAARYRPLAGGSLGLGAITLPLAGARLGIPTSLVLALVAASAATLLDRRPRRRARRSGEAIQLTPALIASIASASAVGAAAGAAAVAARWPVAGDRLLVAAIVPAVTYLVIGLAAVMGIRWLIARGHAPAAAGTALGSACFGVDAVGWWLGSVLAASPWNAAWPLLAAVTLLAAEAARLDHARRDVAGQADELERLHQAHRRILSETGGMAGIAAQFLVECENVLPVDTFQLEVFEGDDGERRSFAAGKDRILNEGEPRPSEGPPMLPGIHKRAAWRLIEHGLRAAAADGGALLGVLRLWCDPRRIEPRDEALLASLVPHLASSLHRARLDREAKLDPLTGVPVRRVLERRLQDVYRHACDEGKPMAVILCDIDHFKRVNDTFGHDAGDHALVAVAGALDTARRDHDLLCRYGGEEFTVLLENASGQTALQVAERLRSAVESLEVVYEGKRLPLALSAGVAAFPELHVKTGSELLLLADEALYRAKEGGRNRSLLNLGRERFVDGDGERYGDAAGTEPALPRLF